MKAFSIIVVLFLILACRKTETNAMQSNDDNTPVFPGKQYTYLALGDSYTIGESVETSGTFPYQLKAKLAEAQLNIAKPQVIARTGWTTAELKSAIATAALKEKFDFVTLLIGVNNQYRGGDAEVYKKEFVELLQTAIDFANGDKSRVFVVSIPDWGVTPFGKSSGRSTSTIAREIDEFNAINKAETLKLNISYIDITPASRLAGSDLSLVASDGLHPSGKMYFDWARNVAPEVLKVLK
jgi:lysophospholipase L1-like esterase